METDVYRRLQQHLDRMPVPFPATASGVEIRILRQLFTAEEAEIALGLSMIPETVETIRKRIDTTLSERLAEILDSMAARGVIQRVGSGQAKRFGKLPLAVGIYELQLTHLTPELQRDVEAYFEEGFGNAFQTATPRQLRTVPVNVAIVPDRSVASYDDIREYVRANDGPFAVMDCICRKGRDLLGEPCSQTTMRQTCLTFGGSAKGMVDSGAAHHITRDEVFDILTAADREGLVLQPQNTMNPQFICCCCGDCCGVLRSAKQLAEPAKFFKSTYHAFSDPGLCSGCAECESRCRMDAIHQADGTAVVDVVRCIGCGLCVTTCATGAMHLAPNATSAEPPKNMKALYLRMYRERFGAYETAKALGKSIVGRIV